MLLARIKADMMAALKAGRIVEKEILRVAVGELTTIEARKGSLSDDEAAAVVRKLVKSNRETIEVATDPEQKKTLEQEIAILEALLPKGLDADGVLAALASVKDAIASAPSDGQATGIAMKALKALGTVVDGKLVGEVVKKLRT
jgi:uncharacterized protein YqeY